MAVLGYPKIKGNSEEIHVKDTVEGSLVNAGYFCSIDNNGNIIPFNGTTVFGVAGRTGRIGQQDVLTRGFMVPCALKTGDNPASGQDAFVNTDGSVSVTGTVKIGTFASSQTIKGIDPNGLVEVDHCSFVDVSIIGAISQPSPPSPVAPQTPVSRSANSKKTENE